MRPIFAALALAAALPLPVRAADLRFPEDAPLHAVQFVDGNEGWAVGDEGVVWHTIDGGKTWERQPTAARASLRTAFPHAFHRLGGRPRGAAAAAAASASCSSPATAAANGSGWPPMPCPA